MMHRLEAVTVAQLEDDDDQAATTKRRKKRAAKAGAAQLPLPSEPVRSSTLACMFVTQNAGQQPSPLTNGPMLMPIEMPA